MILAIALLHFLFILFVAFGGLLVLRWHKLAWLHLPAAVWGALIEIFEWNCPLTGVENSLRTRPYAGDFIAHYLFRVIYPTGLTRNLELAIAAFVIVINLAVYTRVALTSRRSRPS